MMAARRAEDAEAVSVVGIGISAPAAARRRRRPARRRAARLRRRRAAPRRRAPRRRRADAPAAEADGFDELADWRKVYEEFLALKKQCGEATASLTFEKFKGTLQRNKDALVARHACTRVKFTVYVKEGKAALKASPVK